MSLSKRERRRDEKINGEIFNMSPAPSYQHSVVNGNLFSKIRSGLKDSLCLVFMENIDYKYSKESEHYNLKQEITLRAFPITMTLEDIFVF